MVLTDDKKGHERKIPRHIKALVGGCSGMIVTSLVHPLDLVKVRMQVFPRAKTMVEMAKRIVRCEGVPALFVGLSAGLMRQATYTTTRLAVFYYLYEEHRKKYDKLPTLREKMVIGAYAGMAGAFVGNPSEVVLVRMLADGKHDPCGEQCAIASRRYRGLFDAIYKITYNHGIFALWRGATLSMTRSLYVSFAQIGSYTKARDYMTKHHIAEGNTLHFYTSVISSFFTACFTLPVDLVKTRYQFRREGGLQTQPEVFDEILKNHGILYFWKGFIPYFVRLSIHTALTFLILEEVAELYGAYYGTIKK